jgi:hypothetical protein
MEFILILGAPMNFEHFFKKTDPDNDLKSFFEELKDCYSKQGQNFNWDWNSLVKDLNSNSPKILLHYIAFNLSKNIIHGPLPSHLHARMVLDNTNWSKQYVEY